MSLTLGSLSRVLSICWAWIMLAIAVCLISAFLPWFPEGETQSTWFQRSGSFLVVIAVWVQFILSKIQFYFEKDAHSVPIDIPTPMAVFYKVMLVVNIFSMVVGTAIWGYGDLLL